MLLTPKVRATLLALLAMSPLVSCNVGKKKSSHDGSPTIKKHVVLTSNYAGIQNNMVEFYGIFKGDAGDLPNFNTHKKQFKKLMTLGDEFFADETTTLEQLVSQGNLDSLLNDFILPYVSKIPQVNATNLEQSVRAFYNAYRAVPAVHLLFPDQYANKLPAGFKQIKYGAFDKELRTANLSRYSIEFDVEVKASDFMDGNTVNQDKLVAEWIKVAKPLVDEVGKKIIYKPKYASEEFDAKADLLEDNGALAIFNAFVHDLAIFNKLGSKGSFADAAGVRKIFYHSAIGDTTVKNARLYKIFEKNNADVICLQEANLALAGLINSKGFFSKDADSHTDLKNGSRVFLSAKAWKESETKAIEINDEHLAPWMAANKQRVDAWNQALEAKKGKDAATKKIKGFILDKSKEITLVRSVDMKGDLYYIASVHADGSGFGAEAQISVLLNAIEKDAENQDYKVIICHDANTSQNKKDYTKLSKANLHDYLKHLKKNDLNILFDDASDKFVTVNKTRTYLQTQPKKAKQVAKNRSDFIIFKDVERKSRKKINEGPNVNENPTDHAILIGEFE